LIKQKTSNLVAQRPFVAAVGASAGGLEALEQFFRRVDPSSGLAYVVIQHLSPDFDSHMDDLLQRQTALPIQQVAEGTEIRPNNIYLIPPKKEAEIEAGRIKLIDKTTDQKLSLPIDRFFISLANDFGSQSIGVVLSGSGSDGTAGVESLRREGGLVLAQSEESAKFTSMPNSAAATGFVDLVLHPEEMPSALMRFACDGMTREQLIEKLQPQEAPEDYQQVIKLLRDAFDLNFSAYKPQTVMRRIERRMLMQKHSSLENYLDRLKQDSDELEKLYRDLLIGVTQFVRDPEAFQALEERVIPELIASTPESQEIRCWVAGCATGEEAYSLSILFHEQFERLDLPLNLKIFATDVHKQSLAFASRGVYSETSLETLSEDRRNRYFEEQADGYHVIPSVRQSVVFAEHDVLTAAPFTRLDLVSCRNLLIYFKPAVQKSAISAFHTGLRTGGYLLLGASETPGELAREFDIVNRKWKLYRKQRDVRLGPGSGVLGSSRHLTPTLNLAPTSHSSQHDDRRLMAVYDKILEESLSAALLVDENFTLIHTFGEAGRLLQVRSGRLSNSLLELIHPSFRTPLSGAVHHSLKEGKRVQLEGIGVELETGPQTISFQTDPIKIRQTSSRHVLITLQFQEGRIEAEDRSAELDLTQASQNQIETLQNELSFTKENLQATIEELETSNEELQAANEELVASNEELQSTNEELHSVNEELYTVNAEHQRKISELNELNDDLDHLLESSQIAVLFLDEQLNIRKFTPKLSELFSLIPQDHGRPITTFSHRLNYSHLLEDLHSVIETQQTVEREVSTVEGRPLFIRLLPHKSDVRSSGVVMTVIDISPLKRQEAIAEGWAAIAESTGDAIVGMNTQGEILNWNLAAEQSYGYPAAETVGRNFSDLLIPDNEQANWDRAVETSTETKRIIDLDSKRISQHGRLIEVSVKVSPIYKQDGLLAGVSTIERDITSRKNAERELRIQHAVAQILNESTGFPQAITRILSAIVQLDHFLIAEYWARNEQNANLQIRHTTASMHSMPQSTWAQAGEESGLLTAEQIERFRDSASHFEDVSSLNLIVSDGEQETGASIKALCLIPIREHDERAGVICVYSMQDTESLATFQFAFDRISTDIGNFVSWIRDTQRLTELAEIVERSEDFIATLDDNFRIKSLNPAGLKLLGRDLSEVAGDSLLSLLSSQSRQTLRSAAIPEAKQTGVWIGEATLRAEKNRLIPISLMLLVDREQSGKIRYCVAIGRDMTEQKRIQLEHKKAKADAERASQTKSAFLANISHEVRTPMTAVIGIADLLIEEESDPNKLKMLETIAENSRGAAQILNDVLDLSKIVAGMMEINKMPCKPAEIASKLVELFKNRAREKGIRLELRPHGEEVPRTIETDPIRLRQILLNLISNAVKFTDRGSVTITIECTRDDDPQYLIHIEDSGCGVPEDSLETVFQEFSQHDAELDRRSNGTGLGLPISLRLAQALGGTIEVRSEVGAGSCFTLVLPASEAQWKPLAPESETNNEQSQLIEPGLDLRGIKILQVDDAQANRFLVKTFIEKAEGSYIETESGPDAINFIEANDPSSWPHVIIMDMSMPEMSGYEATRQILDRGYEGAIVALTASAMDGDRQRCIDAGCTAYLSKPIDRGEFLRTIRDACSEISNTE